MFSKEFSIAIMEEVFRDTSSASFHDSVLHVTDITLEDDILKKIFMEIPEELQILALQWGLSDTQFRDDVIREIERFKKAYIFSINKLKKAKDNG